MSNQLVTIGGNRAVTTATRSTLPLNFLLTCREQDGNEAHYWGHDVEVVPEMNVQRFSLVSPAETIVMSVDMGWLQERKTFCREHYTGILMTDVGDPDAWHYHLEVVSKSPLIMVVKNVIMGCENPNGEPRFTENATFTEAANGNSSPFPSDLRQALVAKGWISENDEWAPGIQEVYDANHGEGLYPIPHTKTGRAWSGVIVVRVKPRNGKNPPALVVVKSHSASGMRDPFKRGGEVEIPTTYDMFIRTKDLVAGVTKAMTEKGLELAEFTAPDAVHQWISREIEQSMGTNVVLVTGYHDYGRRHPNGAVAFQRDGDIFKPLRSVGSGKKHVPTGYSMNFPIANLVKVGCDMTAFIDKGIIDGAGIDAIVRKWVTDTNVELSNNESESHNKAAFIPEVDENGYASGAYLVVESGRFLKVIDGCGTGAHMKGYKLKAEHLENLVNNHPELLQPLVDRGIVEL